MKNEIKKHAARTLILCLFFISADLDSHVFADSEKSPMEIIKVRNQTVEKILQDTNDNISAEKKEQLKEVINGILDFNELSRRALGKYWTERSDLEKQNFVDVFSKLIKNSSVKKLEVYKADRLVYEEPEINGIKAKVTTIAYKNRKQVEIVYKMHLVDAQWLVYDMDIDGVSTARNYRESFYKKIAKSSYQEMYNSLVKRLEEQK